MLLLGRNFQRKVFVGSDGLEIGIPSVIQKI